MTDLEIYPVKPGDWVASRYSTRRVGRVKDVYGDEGNKLVDIVLYDVNGEKLGRVSLIEGGPRTYEPACPYSDWYRISKPNFPLVLRWMPVAQGGNKVAQYDRGPMLPDRTWSRPAQKYVRRPLVKLDSNFDPEREIAALRRAAQEIRTLSRIHNLPEMADRAIELDKEADALTKGLS